MADNNAGNNNSNDSDRKLVLNKIIFPSLIGIFVLAVLNMILSFFDAANETSKNVFNAFLPVVGTWIGTVIAYYYSKENFEAANKSVRDIVKQVTPLEKLQSISVTDKMIPKDKMVNEVIDDDKIATTKISTLLGKMTTSKVNRLPVLFSNGHPRYMIHRSMLDKYLANEALGKALPQDKLNALTLKNLLDGDPDIRGIFEKGFSVVSEKATLADAKQAMDTKDESLDVLVSKGGTYKEPVTGWITNNIIAENAKV